MSDEERRAEIGKKVIVLQVPGMAEVVVERDVPYRDGAVMDLYRPPGPRDAPRPAVVFVCGFKDPRFGAAFRQMGAYTSWARLLAASGIVAITYGYEEPRADVTALLAHLRQHGAALGIDRLALWAASGNVPMTLGVLMDEPPQAFRCAVLCYGFMLDVPPATHVADAAAHFGMLTAGPGRRVADLPGALPLMVVRAGMDATPGLLQTLDAFVPAALAQNLPLTLINHPAGVHSFDLFEDSEPSRDVIRQVVQFLRLQLGAS